MYLFVYGTLKEGFHNHHYLHDQKFIGRARTTPYYRLFDNGQFPMMVRDRRHGYSVRGELWRLDDDDLIDEIDAHEVSYDRKQVGIRNFRRLAFAYIYRHDVHDLQECYGQWP